MSFLRIAALNLFLLFSFINGNACAQINTPTNTSSADNLSHDRHVDAPNLMTILSLGLDELLRKAKSYGTKLADLGKGTLYSLMALAISFYILSVIFEGGDFFANIHHAIRAMVYFGCVNLVLMDYGGSSEWDVSAWPFKAQQTILNALEVTSASNAPHAVMWEPVMQIFTFAKALWDWLLVEVKPSGNIIQQLTGIFTMLLAILPTFALIVGTILILIICAFLIAATYVTSQIVLAVGIAFGPIFIPFIILRQTSFIASGWISFMITAMLNSIITPFLIKLCSPLLEKLMQIMNEMGTNANGASMFGIACAVLMIAVIMYGLIQKAESIAGGLLSGNGSFGFSARQAIGGLLNTAKSVASPGASTLKAAAASIKSGGTAAASGMRSLASGMGSAKGMVQSAGSVKAAAGAMYNETKSRAQSAISSAKGMASKASSSASNIGGLKDAFNQGRNASYQSHMYRSRY